MIWEKLRGHDMQRDRFRRCLERGRLSHAYLFSGPEGIGKQSFARALAQSLLCERFGEVELEACGECPSCKQMAAGSHPDYIQVGCPPGKSELPIEVFVGPRERRGREGLCHDVSMKPMAGRRKIAVIDDAHLMNAQSANALLKTLEEPPRKSLIILIAAGQEDLLPTIRSRCQLVRFAPLSQDDIARLLIDLGMLESGREGESEAIAALSEGSLSVAAQLLDPNLRQLRDALYEHLAGDVDNPLALAEQLLAGLESLGGDSQTQRRNASWVIRFAAEFYRQSLRILSGSASATQISAAARFVEALDRQSENDVDVVLDLLERVALADNHLQRRTPVPICLESLVDDLARISRTMTKN